MSALLFAAGVWVAMRLVAALYRVIDLWYTIGTRWPGVVVRIAVWSALAALGARRPAFLAGSIAFLVFYPGLYLLRDATIRRRDG